MVIFHKLRPVEIGKKTEEEEEEAMKEAEGRETTRGRPN